MQLKWNVRDTKGVPLEVSIIDWYTKSLDDMHCSCMISLYNLFIRHQTASMPCLLQMHMRNDLFFCAILFITELYLGFVYHSWCQIQLKCSLDLLPILTDMICLKPHPIFQFMPLLKMLESIARRLEQLKIESVDHVVNILSYRFEGSSNQNVTMVLIYEG